MFVLRNAEGTIVAISKITDSSFHESVAVDAGNVRCRKFVGRAGGDSFY
jgi:hypothetical protein